MVCVCVVGYNFIDWYYDIIVSKDVLNGVGENVLDGFFCWCYRCYMWDLVDWKDECIVVVNFGGNVKFVGIVFSCVCCEVFVFFESDNF